MIILKNPWLHKRFRDDPEGIHRTPACCQIRDVLDIYSQKFCVSDGYFSVLATICDINYLPSQSAALKTRVGGSATSWILEVPNLKGSHIVLREYRFLMNEELEVELVVSKSEFFSLGTVQGSVISFNSALFQARTEFRLNPGSELRKMLMDVSECPKDICCDLFSQKPVACTHKSFFWNPRDVPALPPITRSRDVKHRKNISLIQQALRQSKSPAELAPETFKRSFWAKGGRESFDGDAQLGELEEVIKRCRSVAEGVEASRTQYSGGSCDWKEDSEHDSASFARFINRIESRTAVLKCKPYSSLSGPEPSAEHCKGKRCAQKDSVLREVGSNYVGSRKDNMTCSTKPGTGCYVKDTKKSEGGASVHLPPHMMTENSGTMQADEEGHSLNKRLLRAAQSPQDVQKTEDVGLPAVVSNITLCSKNFCSQEERQKQTSLSESGLEQESRSCRPNTSKSTRDPKVQKIRMSDKAWLEMLEILLGNDREAEKRKEAWDEKALACKSVERTNKSAVADSEDELAVQGTNAPEEDTEKPVKGYITQKEASTEQNSSPFSLSTSENVSDGLWDQNQFFVSSDSYIVLGLDAPRFTIILSNAHEVLFRLKTPPIYEEVVNDPDCAQKQNPLDTNLLYLTVPVPDCAENFSRRFLNSRYQSIRYKKPAPSHRFQRHPRNMVRYKRQNNENSCFFAKRCKRLESLEEEMVPCMRYMTKRYARCRGSVLSKRLNKKIEKLSSYINFRLKGIVPDVTCEHIDYT